jgi:hypothetical protein
MAGLERLVVEQLTGKKSNSPGLFERGLENLSDLYNNPTEVGKRVGKYAFDNSAFGTIYNLVKGNPKARKELGELVSRESNDLVEKPGSWRETFKQYFMGNIREGLGEKAGEGKKGRVMDFVYSLPERLYPYANALGRYTTPIVGPLYAWKDAAGFVGGKVKERVKDTIKDMLLKYARPLGYVAGAYALYRVAKYLLQRRRTKKDRTELDNTLSQEDLEETVRQLRDQNQKFKEMAIRQIA